MTVRPGDRVELIAIELLYTSKVTASASRTAQQNTVTVSQLKKRRAVISRSASLLLLHHRSRTRTSKKRLRLIADPQSSMFSGLRRQSHLLLPTSLSALLHSRQTHLASRTTRLLPGRSLRRRRIRSRSARRARGRSSRSSRPGRRHRLLAFQRGEELRRLRGIRRRPRRVRRRARGPLSRRRSDLAQMGRHRCRGARGA